MKSLNKLLSIILAAALAAALSFIFFGSKDAKREAQERPLVSSLTVSPAIPAQVNFCGQAIDLSRYDRHEGLDRELSSFTYLHATTMLLFKRANRIFPIIEPILKRNGIPDDFKYLAVIESSLDPKASSVVRATGVWQFMEATGRQYGLTISATVDERSHVEKSTAAACRYLKDAYAKYGSWMNVAASYNAGMGRISGEQSRQDVDDAMDMWLVEETLRYPYRILAVKLVFESPYQYGFVINPQMLYKPIRTRDVPVKSDIADLAAFARSQGVTYADLKRFNPWLRDRKLITAGKTFVIQIPDPEDLHYDRPNSYVHSSRWVVN
ncbi:MAG: lytic transglycosylase domain-containing protein [Tannerellaceae bacterium]|nr:lytic transglycosylase domain-containing protein [Tannerellaceae bacterium]